MPDPMMVRLAVSTPDSPPLNGGVAQVIAQTNNTNASASAANNSYVHQMDTNAQSTTTPPTQASTSPTQQNSHQLTQNLPPGAIPLNQMSPHHMPPFHHHPHGSGANGAHIHDHNNGHHHNGLYIGPAYANEFYSPGADAPPHYFIPPELCPAHTQLCTVHPDYGPVTVPMVSQSGSPPIPMPVQVPPGHVMQQIVDENGTLRHVILSTQHQQIQGGVQGVQHHIHGHYLIFSTARDERREMETNSRYCELSTYALSSGYDSSTTSSSLNFIDEDLRLLSAVNVSSSSREIHSQTTTTTATSTTTTTRNNNNKNNDNLNGTSVARRTLQRNGTNSAGGGASSVGTSDDGEESSSVPDEEDDFQQIITFLSSVESPTVKEIQSHTALITWEAPPAPTQTTDNALNNLNTNDIRYEILLGDRGKDGKYKSIFRGTNLSCRIQDLRAGQEYHVCLAAHLDDVHGETTEPVLFKTPPREPDIPTAPKVLAKNKNSLQLRWNAPVDNGSHIIHYILEMSTDVDRDTFNELCKIKSKQFTVSKLTPATRYTFRLAAVNECGRSDYSEIVSYVTDGYPPSQPLPPKVHNVTTSSITLLWHRRREDGDFILQMTNQGAQGYMNVYYGPEIIYECSRLQRATAYQFRLSSKTEAGQSAWSDEITVSTHPEQPGRPSKPQVKGKIHANNFKVKWDPPHDRGGADIKLYHLEISSGAIFERVYSGAHTEALCDRLSPGTTYQVRVICEGPGGLSNASDTCTITTEAIVPNPPQTPYYSNLPGPYAAVLQWEKPHYQGGAPVTEYELELEGVLNDGAEKTKQRVVAYRGKESYCVVKDLLPGESYTTHVRAVNRIGAGEWSEEFCFRAGSAPPSKPLAPDVQIRSSTNLFVQWREPQCNGAPILDYKLESSVKQEEDAFSVVYHGTETFADLKGLLPFTNYYFRLHAVNAAGRSPNSTTVCHKTPAAVPGVPTLLPELFAITSSTCHLYWKEPESNGDPIISYVLECGDRQMTIESCRTDMLVEQLVPEQVYKVKVQAVNNIGAGAFTQPHKITTKPLPPKAPRLECIQYGYNSLKLKWGNDGATISSKSANLMDFQRFEVDMKIKSSSKDFQNIYAGTRNSIKVQKLHESTVYAFRICAQTEHAGIGGWSDEYLFKTQAAQPNTVKIIRCIENFPLINSGTNESHVDALPALTVEWQHSKNNHFNDAIEYILQKALAASGSNGNNKNLSYDEIYRGSDTRFTIDCIEYDTDYSFRVIPVRVMRSKRTTSDCSTSTRASSRDENDEVDGERSSDESDDESDDEKEPVKPVTFEYVHGATSPALHYKLPKSAEPVHGGSGTTTTIISSQNVGSSRKGAKLSTKASSAQSLIASNKKHHHHQVHESTTVDSTSTDVSTNEVVNANQSLFLKLLNTIREFFYNRKDWSVTQESIIIWFGFMFFAVVVGCILHFLMA
ncbi:CLUMA_CG014459, isoform B [Clunio marinus]|uniref:CLUMA_CG014459, isoform B n=1 Tax=Clunio marinus TaxID=568069 RepID=A0A1J1IRM4_9DIPT|nr:CLUMA_CG014459, isoform B [Clunio marinus]